MLEAEIGIDTTAMTIPYRRKRQPDKLHPGEFRQNHGFVDTRNRPDVAAAIAEASHSTAFKALLVALAQPESMLFSIGCDLGHADSAVVTQLPPGQYAGGYIQVMEDDYTDYLSQDHHKRLAEIIVAELREKSSDDNWHLLCEVKWVKFELDGRKSVVPSLDVVPSLYIGFDACADSHEEALRSRERMIVALHGILVTEND